MSAKALRVSLFFLVKISFLTWILVEEPSCQAAFVPWGVTPKTSTSSNFHLLTPWKSSILVPPYHNHEDTRSYIPGLAAVRLQVQDVLQEDWMKRRLARQVGESVNLPWARPVLVQVLGQALKEIRSDTLSSQTFTRLQDLWFARQTASAMEDNYTEQQVHDLAQQLASELTEKGAIDVALLNKKQQIVVLKKVLIVVLEAIAFSDEDRRRATIQTHTQLSQDLLGSHDSRRRLAQSLSMSVDVPFIGAKAKEGLMQRVVDMAASSVKAILPSDWIQTLQGESPKAALEMKEAAIVALHESIQMTGLNPEQRLSVSRTIVDTLVNSQIQNTEAEYLFLTPKEQEEKLASKLRMLQYDLQTKKIQFRREQQNLRLQLKRTKARYKKARKKSRRGLLRFFRFG